MNHAMTRRRGMSIGVMLAVVALFAFLLTLALHVTATSLKTLRDVPKAQNASGSFDAALRVLRQDVLVAPSLSGDAGTLQVGPTWTVDAEGTFHRIEGETQDVWRTGIEGMRFETDDTLARLRLAEGDVIVLPMLERGRP